jgi:hypothetical protein
MQQFPRTRAADRTKRNHGRGNEAAPVIYQSHSARLVDELSTPMMALGKIFLRLDHYDRAACERQIVNRVASSRLIE